MVVRMWRGWTAPGNAGAYESVLREEVLPEIAAAAGGGFRGAELLRRDAGGEVEFVTLFRFDSLDTVRRLAGDDYEIAYVPAAARAVLARFEETAAHFETRPLPAGSPR